MLTFVALLALPLMVFAVSKDELTFAQIAEFDNKGLGKYNTVGQFSLEMSIRRPDVVGTTVVDCGTDVYDACFNFNFDLAYQPLKVLSNTTLTLTATYKWGNEPLETYLDQTPFTIEGKLCYSLFAATDRKWRKKDKPYPGITQNCPFDFGNKVSISSVPNAQYIFDMEMQEEDKMPTATFFSMLWVKCQETDEVCAFDTTEKINYVQTEVYDTVTSEMVIVSIVFSIASVAIFILFFTADYSYYKRTGKGLYM
eukprot:gene21625-28628_t